MNEEYKNFIAELYEQNSIVLYNIAYSYIKNDADARDIVEDVFVLALKRVSSLYRHENPGGWLYKVLYYKLKEYYRSKNISISGDAVKILTEDEFDISDIRSESSLEQDVVERISFYRFLQTLPVRERKYIIYRYKAGMKIKDIADKLGISQGAVKQLWHRMKKKLKKIYESK